MSKRKHAGCQPGNYDLIGKLLTLYVKPLTGRQLIAIYCKGVLMEADQKGKIRFVGGDQDVSADLGQFGARNVRNGLYELGEARRIDYKVRKEYVPKPEFDEWKHPFGQENGIRPKVLFALQHKHLFLEGGDYRITADGIIN